MLLLLLLFSSCFNSRQAKRNMDDQYQKMLDISERNEAYKKGYWQGRLDNCSAKDVKWR